MLPAIEYRRSPAARCPLPRPWCLSVGSGAPVEDNCGPQSRATIPFSYMSQFSLLQIDVEVEVPEASENPMETFEIL